MSKFVQDHPRLAVMNFLNEAAENFPDAVSFASGRPADDCFDIDSWRRAADNYVTDAAAAQGVAPAQYWRRLAQYGATAGLIGDAIAQNLRIDLGLSCDASRIIVTAGCQEAIALCIGALVEDARDVVLARNPTYIGLTGVAELTGIALAGISESGDESFADALRRTLALQIAQGRRPRVLYLIPDFDDPTGKTLALAEREEILTICAAHRVVVLEDNPYGMFRFEGEALPPLAALDRDGCVVFLGTYSKTLCPTLRVGCAVLPATLFGEADTARRLAADIKTRKSFLSVNTGQFNQIVVAGVLASQGYSLAASVEPALRRYRGNRDRLTDALHAVFGDDEAFRWNRPGGGFFLALELPFEFDTPEMLRCAAEHGVIVMPMTYFSLDGGSRRSVRFAFSYATPQTIQRGVRGFATYVASRNRLRSAAPA